MEIKEIIANIRKEEDVYKRQYLKQGDGYIKAMNDAAKTQLGL